MQYLHLCSNIKLFMIGLGVTSDYKMLGKRKYDQVWCGELLGSKGMS